MSNPFIKRFGIVIPPSWPPGGGRKNKHSTHNKQHGKQHHKGNPNNTDSELMGAGIGSILILLPFLLK